jgi:hypothetical protein
MHRTLFRATLALGLLFASNVFAQQPAKATAPTAALPAWEQLNTADREALIAPLRDRWNNGDAAHRQRMLEHARRWQTMTPEQRRTARKGMHKWEHLTPDQREQARALYERMRDMDPAQRRALRKQWHAMTPEQRKAWIDQHPPQGGP